MRSRRPNQGLANRFVPFAVSLISSRVIGTNAEASSPSVRPFLTLPTGSDEGLAALGVKYGSAAGGGAVAEAAPTEAVSVVKTAGSVIRRGVPSCGARGAGAGDDPAPPSSRSSKRRQNPTPTPPAQDSEANQASRLAAPGRLVAVVRSA